MKINLLL